MQEAGNNVQVLAEEACLIPLVRPGVEDGSGWYAFAGDGGSPKLCNVQEELRGVRIVQGGIRGEFRSKEMGMEGQKQQQDCSGSVLT